MISIDTLTLTLIVGTVVPLLVGLLTKSAASSGVKAFVNVILSAAGGAGTALLASDGGLPWQSVLIAAFATYVVSGSSYSHLWKPALVTGTPESAIDKSTGNMGLG